MVSKDLVDAAVDEFIEDKKMRFHRLNKAHGTGKDKDKAILLTANANVPRADEIVEDPEKAKADLEKKVLKLQDKFQTEADAIAVASSEESEEDEEAKWDCESIISTYTNTDNHPGVIKT